MSVQLRNDEETQILKLQCQLNNHGLTSHLEGTRDNRPREGCLIFPPPVGSGVSLENARTNNCWLQDQNVCGYNTQSLMDLGFDYGGLVMGFCGPELYHMMGKMMRLMLRLGGDQ